VVAIPLALFDLSTCWVIVHQEIYALLRHSVKELRLVERRNHHYHALSAIVVSVPRHVKIQVVCNNCIKKNKSNYPFARIPLQNVIPGRFNCPSILIF
jgi:hypothetical protein